LNPYIVAFHSQRTEYPKCLDGMTELWRGYSFMFIDVDNSNKWTQNLGDPGSCMLNFKPEFFGTCSDNGNGESTCERNIDQHSTMWLSIASLDGNQDEFLDDLPSRGLDYDRAKNYVSRCVVCESIFRLTVVHTRSNTHPAEVENHACPTGYQIVPNPNKHINPGVAEENWCGYSFWQVSSDKFGVGTQADSQGSCLLDFSQTPLVSCNNEECRLKKRTRNTWLMSDTQRDSDYKSFGESGPYVSRCVVCRRPEAKLFRQE